MKNYRLIILAVLGVLVLASGYYWTSLARHPGTSAVSGPALEVDVTTDSAISIDGERFTDPAKLRAILAVVRKQQPIAVIVARTPKEISAENLGKAAKLLHDSGEGAVSFEFKKTDERPD